MIKINKQVFNELTKQWEIIVEEIEKPKEQVDKENIKILEINQVNIQRELDVYDKKILKYKEQQELVELELLEETDLSPSEYKDLLVLKQNKRLHHREIQDEINIIKQNWGW